MRLGVSDPDNAFPGGGEMGALMRALDWSKTPLGPVSAWPQSLLTSVSTCLDCAFPILIWWGPELVMLYNDEYRPILGSEKHPAALGSPGRQVWPELWDVIGPMLGQVVSAGQATRSRDLLLLMNRHGYQEETYFSFSYSPIRDETGGVGGVFTPVIETTGKVIGERRLRTLRELAAAAGSASVDGAIHSALHVLSPNDRDVPFALIYALEDDGSAFHSPGGAGTDAWGMAGLLPTLAGDDARHSRPSPPRTCRASGSSVVRRRAFSTKQYTPLLPIRAWRRPCAARGSEP